MPGHGFVWMHHQLPRWTRVILNRKEIVHMHGICTHRPTEETFSKKLSGRLSVAAEKASMMRVVCGSSLTYKSCTAHLMADCSRRLHSVLGLQRFRTDTASLTIGSRPPRMAMSCRSILFRFNDSSSSSPLANEEGNVGESECGGETVALGAEEGAIRSRIDGSRPADGYILTIFRWPRHVPCESVAVKGSFDGWTHEFPLERLGPGKDWSCGLMLPPGRVHFKYVVDGRFVTSPSEPVINESCGTYNNLRLVYPSAHFSWPTALLGGSDIAVVGEWDYWQRPLQLLPTGTSRGKSSKHTLDCCLPPGNFNFHYVVDGETRVLPSQDKQVGAVVKVPQAPAVRLFYATGWNEPKLKGRWLGQDGLPLTDWQVFDFHETTARCVDRSDTLLSGSNGGKCWKYAIVDCCTFMTGLFHDGVKPDELEFIPFDPETGAEDRPAHGGVYTCSFPGGYKLTSGTIRPFNQACEAPMMLVSDIDGTLVGHEAHAVDSTARFGKYWEDRAALTGSFLVYNTGRSLGQVVGLLEQMKGVLPIPDAIISAVGTKIFLLDRERGHRGSTSGSSWHEDMDWAHSLDDGWDLQVVRKIANAAIQKYSESKVNWLDDGSEHPHRIALSVHVDSLDAVSELIHECLEKDGINFKLISSGTMDWRYLDCVSGNAGKHAALEHIRTMYGVALDRCVAAGDSGNDILMLEGPNPAIVVGNAQQALVEWVVQQPQDGRIVVTDATVADGVLEGLCRHQLY